jgi:tetratricopeptide (TPR) repeat protein
MGAQRRRFPGAAGFGYSQPVSSLRTLLFGKPAAAQSAESPAPEDDLPLPPELPRLASGADYETCLALTQSDPDAARSFAEAWEKNGGGEGARHCLALALLADGEAASAAERLETLARNSQANLAARIAVFSQAVEAWNVAGQPARAYAAATMGLTVAPNDADLLIDRALALGALGRFRDALPDLEQVGRQQPNRVDAWVLRGTALRHLDRLAEAEAAVTQSLTLDPENPEGLLERGILKQMRGDLAGARHDWEQVLQLAPDSPAADLAAQNLALNEAGPQRR